MAYSFILPAIPLYAPCGQKFVFRMIIGRQFFLISNLQCPRSREHIRRFVCHWEQHGVEASLPLSILKFFKPVPPTRITSRSSVLFSVFVRISLCFDTGYHPVLYSKKKKKVERRQYFTLCFVKYFCLPIPPLHCPIILALLSYRESRRLSPAIFSLSLSPLSLFTL